MNNRDIIFMHGRSWENCDANVAKFFEGYYSLQYSSRGRVEIFYDDREYSAQAGWFWPAYPGPYIRFHAAAGERNWDHHYVAFRGPLASQWLADGIFPTAPQKAPVGGNFAERMDKLIELMQAYTRFSNLRAVNMLEGILLELAEANDIRRSKQDAWLDFMLDHLADPENYPADYDALARQAGMATSSLRREFKKKVGMPMHMYSLLARITAAQKLLLETDMPIKKIADKLKFRDVYFFTRQFKKYAQIPPGEFRKSGQITVVRK